VTGPNRGQDEAPLPLSVIIATIQPLALDEELPSLTGCFIVSDREEATGTVAA
jgi:hypothetical protein